jgi:hypothetical protein
MKGTAMTAQQRDMIDQILRNAPFDLGGDVAAQRPLLEQMFTSQPLPADVRVTPADLGGVPVIFTDIAGHRHPEGGVTAPSRRHLPAPGQLADTSRAAHGGRAV